MVRCRHNAVIASGIRTLGLLIHESYLVDEHLLVHEFRNDHQSGFNAPGTTDLHTGRAGRPAVSVGVPGVSASDGAGSGRPSDSQVREKGAGHRIDVARQFGRRMRYVVCPSAARNLLSMMFQRLRCRRWLLGEHRPCPATLQLQPPDPFGYPLGIFTRRRHRCRRVAVT